MSDELDFDLVDMGENIDVPGGFIGRRFHHCIVQKQLKEGGQGFSFLAWDTEIKKERVVKISRFPMRMDERDENKNFQKEGIILARLRHPQIVDLQEQGEAFNHRYMIIDYINGFDFNKVMRILRAKCDELETKWNKILDPATALALVCSALQPLAYAHKVKIQLPGEGLVEGLAHRDISSGNLILGLGHEYEGMVHVIDFGMAKTNFETSLTSNTNLIGTVRYVCPMRLMNKGKTGLKESEYWEGFKQTQYDVHSMGCFLFELLTGDTHIHYSDLQQCLAAVCDIHTYKKLYKDIRVFDKKIQDIIRKSIVFPDFEKGGIPYQYKTAEEMHQDVYDAFKKISGGKELKSCISDLADCISNPGDIVRQVDGKSSRVIRYSTNASLSQISHKRPNRSILISIMLLLSLSISVLALLLAGPKISRYFPYFNGPSKSSSAATANPAPKSQQQVPNIIRESSPPPKADKNLSRTPKPIKSRQQNLKRDYLRLTTLLKSGKTIQAYKLVNVLWDQYHDPAFLLIKALLIKQRNPSSSNIGFLVEEARNKKSHILSQADLAAKIAELEE